MDVLTRQAIRESKQKHGVQSHRQAAVVRSRFNSAPGRYPPSVPQKSGAASASPSSSKTESGAAAQDANAPIRIGEKISHALSIISLLISNVIRNDQKSSHQVLTLHRQRKRAQVPQEVIPTEFLHNKKLLKDTIFFLCNHRQVRQWSPLLKPEYCHQNYDRLSLCPALL